jgi:hypothetical protein
LYKNKSIIFVLSVTKVGKHNPFYYLAASDKVYQLLAHGQWFSPASCTTKTGRHVIAEILLKVALNTINQTNQIYNHT